MIYVSYNEILLSNGNDVNLRVQLFQLFLMV